MSRKRKGQARTGTRWTPPNVDRRTLPGAAQDAAHQEIGKRIGAHLERHKVWVGNLHGKRVRITIDEQGTVHHRILGKAR